MTSLDDKTTALWRTAVDLYLASTLLHPEVDALVAGFFARHPDLQRTPRAEAFVSGLALDRIYAAARAATQPETQKVA